MSGGAFAFNEIAGETLEDKALRACEVIVSAGLGIRGGKICAGGNNVMARNAAMAFSIKELNTIYFREPQLNNEEKHSQDMLSSAASVISLYKDGSGDDGNLRMVQDGILRHVLYMKELGWGTDVKPTNFDVNAAGVKLHGYVEPTGVTVTFAKVFGILPKSSMHYKASKPQ